MSTEGFILLILGFCLAVVLTFLVPAYLGKKKRTNKKPNRRVSVSESASSDTANPFQCLDRLCVFCGKDLSSLA